MTTQTETEETTAKATTDSTGKVTKVPAKATPKPKAAPTPMPAAKAEPKATPKPRVALTPAERAAKPVTATIASYIDWLNKTVYAGKMTKAQIEAAGTSITLYGAFQSSPERKAARG